MTEPFRPPAAGRAEVADTDVQPTGSGDYALIAEFDAARASVYRRIISEAGLAVTAVRDGDAARAVLDRQGAPRLLVTDLSLPRTDGLTLIRHLRQHVPAERTAVLVLSAFAPLRELATKAQVSLGITAIAEKSLDPEAFRRMVARALGTPILRPGTAPGTSTAEQLVEALLQRCREIALVPLVGISADVAGRRLVRAHVDASMPLDRLAGDESTPESLLQRAAATRQPVVSEGPRGPSPETGFGLPESAIRGRAAVPLLTTSGCLIGVATLFDLKPLNLSRETLDALLQEGRAFADEIELHHAAKAAMPGHPKNEGADAPVPPLTDPLSGLYTRTAGEQAVVREAARVRRTGYPASVALLDIDGFADLNQRHGREAGDHILRKIGRLLRSSFRQSDLSVRWGADEFLIVLSDVPLGGAERFAERVRTAIEELVEGSIDRLTCSGGVVELGPHETPGSAIQRAEIHLRAAKAAGGNRIAGGTADDSAAHTDAGVRDGDTPLSSRARE